MNEMIITNAEFGSIRIEMRNGEPWFIGSSVAKVLKYQNQQKAIRDHVDAEDKLTEQIVLAGQRREVTLINESGLYSLILSSKMEEAKRFKHWITSEVLPAIRKTGGYQQTEPQGKELLALAVLEAQKTIEEQNRAIERMRPKEIFADAVSASKTSILIGDLAKLIKQNGVDIGEKRLFQWMRENGYLIRKDGASYNMPTQKSMDLEVMEIKESTITQPNGNVRISRTPKVTGKGQRYFVNKILSAMA
jgi:anti-repressor protein